MSKRKLVNRTTKGWVWIEDNEPPCKEAPPGVIHCNEHQPADLARDPAHIALACATRTRRTRDRGTQCAECVGPPWCHFHSFRDPRP
jgi:hypothetical protein